MTENVYGTVHPTPTGAGGTQYSPPTSYGTDAGASGYGSDSDGGRDGASLKDKAGDTAEAGKQAAGDVAQTAADHAKDVANETKRQARDLVGEARSQLSEQASAQHRNLVSNLRALADELSSMADNGGSGGTASDLVGQAGDRAHNVADWLDRREPGDLLGEVRSFAQQRPGAFLLGAVAAGVVAGRLTRGAVAAHSDSGSSRGSSDGSAISGGAPVGNDVAVGDPAVAAAPYPATGELPAPASDVGAPGTAPVPVFTPDASVPEQTATTPSYSTPPSSGLGGGAGQ